MKKCKNCQTRFEPRFSTFEKYCWNPDCKTIEALGKLQQHKKDQQKKSNIAKKEMKTNLMTKQDWEKILEALVNKFVRLRDADKPCISCGAPAGHYTMSAGHLYPAGSYKNIRFNLWNVNGQCWYNCNKNKHGNINAYRIGLSQRIGAENLAELDQLAQQERRYTIPEIQEMIQEFKGKIKEIEKK
jgi:hypothetical protein